MPCFRARNVSPCSVFLRSARETDDEGELNSGAQAAAALEQCRFSGLPTGTATMASVKPKAAALLTSSSPDASAVISVSWSDAEAVTSWSDAEAVTSWSDAEAVISRADAVGAVESAAGGRMGIGTSDPCVYPD